MAEHLEHMIVVGPAAHREREGYIKNLSEAQAKALEAELQDILDEHGVKVSVEPVMVHDAP